VTGAVDTVTQFLTVMDGAGVDGDRFGGAQMTAEPVSSPDG
jgi:hypothetical protein